MKRIGNPTTNMPVVLLATVLANLLMLKGAVGDVPSSPNTLNIANDDGSTTYSSLTKPMPLYPGEVANTWQDIAIPPGPIAISEFAADVVEVDDATGAIRAVPLDEAYLHHHAAFSSQDYYHLEDKKAHWLWWRWSSSSKNKPATVHRGVDFRAGTESRSTRQKFPYPFRFTTVWGEDKLVANVHIINTRAMPLDQAHHCLQCPCTAEDRVVSSDGNNMTLLKSVVDRRHNWDECNNQLMNENNTACSPDTYQGGLLCCHHGEFCLDDFYMHPSQVHHNASNLANSVQSTYYLRYNLTYKTVSSEVRPLHTTTCCDATGNITHSGNIEYDIPQLCNDRSDNSPTCIHKLETIQQLDGLVSKGDQKNVRKNTYVNIVHMVGHLHRGGTEITAYLNDAGGNVVCQSVPFYGSGSAGEIGNEPGYIISMSKCIFDPPLRLKTTDQLRVVAKYNATEAHTGVMALFYIAVADDTKDHVKTGRHWGRFQLLALALLSRALYVIARHYWPLLSRRRGYEPLPRV